MINIDHFNKEFGSTVQESKNGTSFTNEEIATEVLEDVLDAVFHHDSKLNETKHINKSENIQAFYDTRNLKSGQEKCYRCPIDACSQIIAQDQLENGTAARHMLNLHKIPPCKMIRSNLKWKQVSSCNFDLIQPKVEILAPNDKSNETPKVSPLPRFITEEKIQNFKEKLVKYKHELCR